MTPAAELSAMAAKLGLITAYKILPPVSSLSEPNDNEPSLPFLDEDLEKPEAVSTPASKSNNKQGTDKSAGTSQRYVVELTFAGRLFIGEENTFQLAKNSAASKALEFFANDDNFIDSKRVNSLAPAASIQNLSSVSSTKVERTRPKNPPTAFVNGKSVPFHFIFNISFYIYILFLS